MPDQFTILMIGNSSWSTQLAEELVKYHKKNRISTIQVHRGRSVESTHSTLSNVYVDLAIILFDVRKSHCLLDVEVNLLALEPALLRNRTILVNPINIIKYADMGVSYANIDSLKRKYNLLLLHGNIEGNTSKMLMAKKIMIYLYKININGAPNFSEFNSIDM